MIKNGEIAFIINTPSGKSPRRDEVVIRGAAVSLSHPDHDHAQRGGGQRGRHPLVAGEGLEA